MSNPLIVNTSTGKIIKTVKNLGWLLRHTTEITDIEIKKDSDLPYSGASISCNLTNNRAYTTNFASFAIALHWFSRRALKGIPVRVFNCKGDMIARWNED
jgi:hypothetical protein